MKNFKITLMCLAAAAMTFTACSNVEEFSPNTNSKNSVTVIAGSPEVQGDTRTHFGQIGENICPMWSNGDKIYMIDWNTMVTDSKATVYTSNPLAEAVAKAQFTFTNLNESLQENDPISFIYSKNVKNVDEIGNISKNYKSIALNIPYEMTPADAFDFSDGDILISEDNMTYQKGEIKAKFKRFTSVARVFINKAADLDIAADDYVSSLELSDYYMHLVGGVDYVLTTKETTYSDNNKRLNINLSKLNYSIGNNQSFMFSCAPVAKDYIKTLSYEQQDCIKFTVRTKSGRKFVKTVKDLYAKNFELRPGTISTIKLNLSKADEIDVALPEYTPGSGTVTVKQLGSLSREVVADVIGTGSSIKVIGDINDDDMNGLRDYLKNAANPCKVDLSEVNLMDENGEMNTSIGKNFITSEHNISELILPNSLIHILAYAITMRGTQETTIVLGKSLVSMERNAINNELKDENIKFNLIIKASHIGRAKQKYDDFCIGCSITGFLKLNRSWQDPTIQDGLYRLSQNSNTIMWKGSKVSEAYYTDFEGNNPWKVDPFDLPVRNN